MKIAIIGSGNVGGALAQSLTRAGHDVTIGVRMPLSEKSKALAKVIGDSRFKSVQQAVNESEVIILSTPAMQAIEISQSLGDTTGKIIIDTMNVVMGRGPQGFTNTADAILANTKTRDVVKCFNTTGFENLSNPVYQDLSIDMFVAGESLKGKLVAIQLAKDIGFRNVWDMGGNDKFFLTEQLACVWINLAIFQKQGRDIAFKIVKRNS